MKATQSEDRISRRIRELFKTTISSSRDKRSVLLQTCAFGQIWIHSPFWNVMEQQTFSAKLSLSNDRWTHFCCFCCLICGAQIKKGGERQKREKERRSTGTDLNFFSFTSGFFLLLLGAVKSSSLFNFRPKSVIDQDTKTYDRWGKLFAVKY